MKLALYQTYPGTTLRSYNLVTIGKTGTQVTLFEPTVKGLQEAINAAKRSDAVILKVEKDYFTSEGLLNAVRKMIKDGKGFKVFMPAIGIERELLDA